MDGARQPGQQRIGLSDCVGDWVLAPHDASLSHMEQKYASMMGRDRVLELLV